MNQFKLIDINTIIDATSFAESDNTAELEDELAKRKKSRYLRADFFAAVFLVIFLVFTLSLAVDLPIFAEIASHCSFVPPKSTFHKLLS